MKFPAVCLLSCLTLPGSLSQAKEPGIDVSQLMRGSPPPEELRVSRDNFMLPPYNRWAFQHIRELQPTREIYRGSGPVSALAERPVDLDAMTFSVRDGRRVSLPQWLEESMADAFLVLHRGELVYERYLNGQRPHVQHQMFSATKSLVGTLVLVLIEEGLVDPGRPMQFYVPDLAGSAFGDATVQQVLDMTTSLNFSEEYTDPGADIWRYGRVFGLPSPPGAADGAGSIHEYLPTLKPMELPHGKAFHYVTPNTDALAWMLSRVTGKTLSQLFEERFWQPLGMERDGYVWLGRGGTEMAGGGLNITARDAARFGQMILQKGKYNGRRVLPRAVAERILKPGNPETFSVLYDDPWYQHVGYAYHDQWWTFANDHRAVSAIGVHGQFIYLDAVADMVVIKQSSHPDAEGPSNEVDGPLIWQQIAEHLKAGGS